MTKKEIVQAILDGKTMPFIQLEQLIEIVDFVIKNYKPSLLSNLDEATENHMLSITTLAFDERDIILSFKAGAEWMAGQGVTAEGEILDVSGRPLADRVIRTMSIKEMEQCLKDFNKGDKVVVQIRKK